MTKFVQLSNDDGTWEAFLSDWQKQCEVVEEDFEDYSAGSLSVLQKLVDAPEKGAGVFALEVDGTYLTVCQINVTPLPKYTGPVMRVRYLSLSPYLDYDDVDTKPFGLILGHTFLNVVKLSDVYGWSQADHIKFHLRSPSDNTFFTNLGKSLEKVDEFTSVQTRGAWLYITK